MSFIDDSPGLFFFLVNCVVYAVIGVEIVMIGSPTVTAVALTMALIASIAIGINFWMHHLLSEQDDEDAPIVVAEAAPAVEAEQAPTPVERRPVVRPALPRMVAH